MKTIRVLVPLVSLLVWTGSAVAQPADSAPKQPPAEPKEVKIDPAPVPAPTAAPVDGEKGTYRMIELETRLQPVYDWLANRHHDFIRLNHFSESFSILRWLRDFDIEIVALIPDGKREELPTPDRVLIGQGPQVKPPRR